MIPSYGNGLSPRKTGPSTRPNPGTANTAGSDRLTSSALNSTAAAKSRTIHRPNDCREAIEFQAPYCGSQLQIRGSHCSDSGPPRRQAETPTPPPNPPAGAYRFAPDPISKTKKIKSTGKSFVFFLSRLLRLLEDAQPSREQ